MLPMDARGLHPPAIHDALDCRAIVNSEPPGDQRGAVEIGRLVGWREIVGGEHSALDPLLTRRGTVQAGQDAEGVGEPLVGERIAGRSSRRDVNRPAAPKGERGDDAWGGERGRKVWSLPL